MGQMAGLYPYMWTSHSLYNAPWGNVSLSEVTSFEGANFQRKLTTEFISIRICPSKSFNPEGQSDGISLQSILGKR